MTINSMIKLLRKNEIKAPNNFGINKSEWVKNCKKYNATEELKDAGIFIIDTIERIKNDLHNNNIYQLKKEVALQYITGRVNLLYCIIREKMFNVSNLEHKTDPINTVQQYFEDINNNIVSPDGYITKSIDALKYHLCSINFNCKGSSKEIHPEDLISFDFCGQMLENISHFWQNILWNNWIFSDESFCEPYTESNQYISASSFRQIQYETSVSYYLNSNIIGNKKKFRRKKIHKEKINHKSKIKVIDTHDENPTILTTSKLLLEEYYNNIMTKNGKDGYSISNLFDLWEFLSEYCDYKLKTMSIIDRAPLKTSQLHNFNIKIKKDNLIKLICRAYSWNRTSVIKMFDFLLFDFKYKTNLWTKPIIECNGYIYLIAPLFHTAKASFLLSKWLKISGISENDKGTAYENWLYNKLKNSKPYYDSFSIIDKKEFKSINKVEETDLIFILGNTLWVCELKCNELPIDPIQFHNYEKDIENGSIQAKNKKNYISNHLSELSFASNIKKVKALVITNQFALAGTFKNNVPIIDHHSLKAYISSNKIDTMIQIQGSSETKNTNYFYKDKLSYENNFEDYLSKNPFIEIYKKLLKYESFPIKYKKQKVFEIKRFHIDENKLNCELSNTIN